MHFCYRKNCNHPFFEVKMSFLFVVPLFVTHCQSLSFVVTQYDLFSLVVPLVVTRCHSLSFAVSGCHLLLLVEPLVAIRCHSLSLVVPLLVTRCHSMSLVVTQCTSRLSFYKRCINNRPCLCIPYLSLLFYLLSGPVKVHVKY